jgi:heme-degrading monooxygenase HmoA
MIVEIADILIKQDRQREFEQAVSSAVTTIFPKAKGFRGHVFYRCIETPGRYSLQLTWDTLDNHTVDFRGSPLFIEWRAMVGDCFAQPPHVEHFESVN